MGQQTQTPVEGLRAPLARNETWAILEAILHASDVVLLTLMAHGAPFFPAHNRHYVRHLTSDSGVHKCRYVRLWLRAGDCLASFAEKVDDAQFHSEPGRVGDIQQNLFSFSLDVESISTG